MGRFACGLLPPILGERQVRSPPHATEPDNQEAATPCLLSPGSHRASPAGGQSTDALIDEGQIGAAFGIDAYSSHVLDLRQTAAFRVGRPDPQQASLG